MPPQTPTAAPTGRRVAVLGAGAWGSAFALVLADAGCSVRLWARRPEVVQEVRRRRTRSEVLGDVLLPDGVEATGDDAEALDGADLVVLAVPLQRLRERLHGWRPLLPDVPLVCLAKGVEAGTGLFGTEVAGEVTAADPERLVAVSGPNLAAEVARREPAGTVVACADAAVARDVAAACTTPAFLAEATDDLVGVDVAGAVKNVVALAVGVVEGAGLGANARAAVLTRGLAETTRLGLALGARPETFIGLAGVGDLVATCSSPLSRNHRAGTALGRGADLPSAVAAAGGTVEGITSAAAVLRRAESVGAHLPLVAHVAAAVAAGRAPRDLATRLVAR